MKQTAEVDAPDGEHYVVVVRRWNPFGTGPIAWASLLVRWAWKFGRWTVEVNRRVPASEYRSRLLPYAFRWHGGPMSEQEAEAEFSRVMTAIRMGHWPDPHYER